MKNLEEVFAFLESGEPPAKEAGLFGATIPEELASIHVLGVPWDVTVSYGEGTHKAPEAIRQASHQLDLMDFSFGQIFRAGIRLKVLEQLSPVNSSMRPMAQRVIQALESHTTPHANDLQMINDACRGMNQLVLETARESLSQGKKVGLLGGDHSTPFGLLQAIAEVHKRFGVLHIDAHHDLRCGYEGFTYSHASIFYNVLERIPQVVKLCSVGVRDYAAAEGERALQDERISTWYDEALFASKAEGTPWGRVVDNILRALPDKVYLSLDIDGLSREFCPNTGTPVPGGLSFQEVAYLIQRLGRSDKEVIGFDLVEVGDSEDEWDANVGARLLYKCCGLLQR